MHISLVKFIAILTGLFLGLNAAMANSDKCDVKINGNADFIGIWVLESTRPSLVNGGKSTHELWQFHTDGSFELTARDPRAADTIKSKSTFKVENNRLKIARVGRAGKFYDYQLCAKDDTKMTLFGGIEGFHFFSKK